MSEDRATSHVRLRKREIVAQTFDVVVVGTPTRRATFVQGACQKERSELREVIGFVEVPLAVKLPAELAKLRRKRSRLSLKRLANWQPSGLIAPPAPLPSAECIEEVGGKYVAPPVFGCPEHPVPPYIRPSRMLPSDVGIRNGRQAASQLGRAPIAASG